MCFWFNSVWNADHTDKSSINSHQYGSFATLFLPRIIITTIILDNSSYKSGIFAILTTCFVYQGSRDMIFKSCARLEFQIWAEYFLFWGEAKPQIEFFGDGKKFRSV